MVEVVPSLIESRTPEISHFPVFLPLFFVIVFNRKDLTKAIRTKQYSYKMWSRVTSL